MIPSRSGGRGIGAFFDLDGTLIPPPTLERRFRGFLRWRGELTAVRQMRWVGRFLSRCGGEWLAATEGNKAHLAGVRAALVQSFLASLARHPANFFPDAVARIEWHTTQGHTIFLITGTPEPLAKAIASRLPWPTVVRATRLEIVNGRWTGRAAAEGDTARCGDALCGPAKAAAIRAWAEEFRLDLSRSFAYGDSAGDRWMLECVGNPAAVNPDARLRRLARRRGWPALYWGQPDRQRHGSQSAQAATQILAEKTR